MIFNPTNILQNHSLLLIAIRTHSSASSTSSTWLASKEDQYYMPLLPNDRDQFLSRHEAHLRLIRERVYVTLHCP